VTGAPLATMKLKFWRLEYEFDREDAKIVMPTILLLLGVFFSRIDATLLLALTAVYYLIYFFSTDAITAIRDYAAKLKMRCPHCKNRKIILQGYDGYKSDECYAYYFCDACKTTSILTDGGLLKI
jgi:hypothetical protein